MFRIFINEFTEALRTVIREKFPDSVLQDPALLVADDVIDLSAKLEEMKLIADTCVQWARDNGLSSHEVEPSEVQTSAHADTITNRTTQRTTRPQLDSRPRRQPNRTNFDGGESRNRGNGDFGWYSGEG